VSNRSRLAKIDQQWWITASGEAISAGAEVAQINYYQ
jgi:hypothetical protein